MATTDHRKQSLYFPEEMLVEIEREAERQDRSLSWIVQQAWKIASADLKAHAIAQRRAGPVEQGLTR
jgi:uncharacterized small protein (TIGR04563 family)